MRRLLSLSGCPQHPPLLPVRPFSSLRCKAGRCGHPLSRLLLEAPSPPSPSSRGCLWSYSSASAFHNSSKADASILSGDGDVRRMARERQAGVGRFPAISRAWSPLPVPRWLVPGAWAEAWGRNGEGERMGGRVLGYADPTECPAGVAGMFPAVCTL